jgi:hypothetical protein
VLSSRQGAGPRSPSAAGIVRRSSSSGEGRGMLHPFMSERMKRRIGIPCRTRPSFDRARPFFGAAALRQVTDSHRSAHRRNGRLAERCISAQPTMQLVGPKPGMRPGFQYPAQSDEVRGKRLRRCAIIVRMLKTVGVDEHPMARSERSVGEASVKESLETLAAAGTSTRLGPSALVTRAVVHWPSCLRRP